MYYYSGNLKIALCSTHDHLWTVSFPDGGFFTISSTEELIRRRYPPTQFTRKYFQTPQNGINLIGKRVYLLDPISGNETLSLVLDQFEDGYSIAVGGIIWRIKKVWAYYRLNNETND